MNDGGLVAFLKARLDEDERYLNSNRHHLWTDRPLRAVAARRAMLAYYEHAQSRLDYVIEHPGEMSSGDEGMWLGKAAASRMACRHDAAVYSDHADYRQEWTP